MWEHVHPALWIQSSVRGSDLVIQYSSSPPVESWSLPRLTILTRGIQPLVISDRTLRTCKVGDSQVHLKSTWASARQLRLSLGWLHSLLYAFELFFFELNPLDRCGVRLEVTGAAQSMKLVLW